MSILNGKSRYPRDGSPYAHRHSPYGAQNFSGFRCFLATLFELGWPALLRAAVESWA